MALYLGNSEKLKINLGNVVYNLNLINTSSAINNIILLSSDNYVLQDCNGLYLTIKEND